MKWRSSNVEGRGAVASKWGRATLDRRASLVTALCALITIGPTNHSLITHCSSTLSIQHYSSNLLQWAAIVHWMIAYPISFVLVQESRTLEMNNVHEGTWHGRGDTMCIGTYVEGVKAFEPPIDAIDIVDQVICTLKYHSFTLKMKCWGDLCFSYQAPSPGLFMCTVETGNYSYLSPSKPIYEVDYGLDFRELNSKTSN
ncbi:PLAC8 family protein [Tanacetum coccineum]